MCGKESWSLGNPCDTVVHFDRSSLENIFPRLEPCRRQRAFCRFDEHLERSNFLLTSLGSFFPFGNFPKFVNAFLQKHQPSDPRKQHFFVATRDKHVFVPHAISISLCALQEQSSVGNLRNNKVAGRTAVAGRPGIIIMDGS